MRPSFTTTAFDIARVYARRSTCLRLHTAAVVCTPDERIIAAGYNGSLPGQVHCDDPCPHCNGVTRVPQIHPCFNCQGTGKSYFSGDILSGQPVRCGCCNGSGQLQDDTCPTCRGSGVVGCDVVDGHCVRTVHAELNAILQAAKVGISLAGCTMYTLHTPCAHCANAIVQAGIIKVVVAGIYESHPEYNASVDVQRRFEQAGVVVLEAEAVHSGYSQGDSSSR